MLRAPNRFILAAGFLCTMIGIGVIVGWQFRLSEPMAMAPDDAVMTYNAGIAFLLCGLGSICVGLRWIWPGRVFSAIAALVGAMTLAEHVFRLSSTFDQLFLKEHVSASDPHPGRMGYIAALCFLISGIALVMMVWSKPGARRPFVSAALGATVCALGLSSMAQHLAGIRPAAFGNSLIDMAVNTSVGFIILGLGIAYEAWRGASPETTELLAVGGFLPPALMQPWAPVLLGCMAAAISVLVWRGLVIKQDAEINRSVELEAARAENDINTKLAARAMTLYRLSHQWDIYGDISRTQWMNECMLVEQDLPGWQAITLVDPAGHVQWTCPRNAGGVALGSSVFDDPARKAAFLTALHSGGVVGTRQVDVGSGHRGFLMVVAIRSHGERLGYLAGVFRSDVLFPAILSGDLTRGFAVGVYDAGVDQRPFWSRASLPDANATPTLEPYAVQSLLPWEQVKKIGDFGLGWHIHVRPTAPLLEQEQSSIPGLALGLGLMFACMVGATVHFARTARLHSVHVVDINKTLEKEIAERLAYMKQVEVERESALQGWAEAERQAALLVSQAQELKRSNGALTEFASIASHDLKEPLRKIQTFGDMLRRRSMDSLDADGVGYLDRMTGAAQRMQMLIDGLLAYSRVSTRPPDLVRVDLNELVRGVCGDLEARIADGGARVDCGDLPVLNADPVQMRQLFQNLIGNALKFRRAGVAPVVTLRGEQDRNGVARITISDNGIGFEPKFADRIFRIFERLEAPTRYEGTGIGLAICRTIIERHHGTIVASAAPDKGATFTLELPCEIAASGGRSAP